MPSLPMRLYIVRDDDGNVLGVNCKRYPATFAGVETRPNGVAAVTRWFSCKATADKFLARRRRVPLRAPDDPQWHIRPVEVSDDLEWHKLWVKAYDLRVELGQARQDLERSREVIAANEKTGGINRIDDRDMIWIYGRGYMAPERIEREIEYLRTRYNTATVKLAECLPEWMLCKPPGHA